MCHQTVGLIAGEIERNGITTVSVTLLREVTEKVRVPRALFFSFPLGYPLGRPGDPAFQMALIRQTLALAADPGPPPILREGVTP